LLAACGDDGMPAMDAGDAGADGGDADAAMPAPTATFSPGAAGTMSYGDAPWPNDLFLGDDGTVDVVALPGTGAVWEPVNDALRDRRGFCVSCAIFFPVSGELDGSSVTDASVVLVELDPVAGAAVGDPIPLHVEYNGLENIVAARPSRGIVLERERTYAAALLAGALDVDGAPLLASDAFVAVRDSGPSADARALEVVGPAIDAIEGTGVARGDILAASAFTTWDPTEPVREITGVVDAYFATTPPTVTFERVLVGAELDDVFGVPAEQLPGHDNLSAPGEEGEWAVAHDALAMLVVGTVTGPRTVEGSGTDIGFPRRNSAGALVAGPEAETIPFLLWVPVGVDLSSLTVALTVVGIGGRKEGIPGIQPLLDAGYAALTYDPFNNGRRAASAADETHWLRGEGAPMTPDGFVEHDSANVALRTFALDGAEPDLLGCVLYGYGTLVQQVTDIKTMMRLLRSGDWSDVQSSVPELVDLAIDTDREVVLGASLGSYTATAALIDEPDVEAAIFVVPYGSGVDVLAESPGFRSQVDSVISPILGVRSATTYDEDALHLAMHPVFDSYRWLADGVEAQVNVRHLVSDPLHAGGLPDILWQLGDIDETTGTPTGDSLCAAAGVPGFGDYPFADVAPATLPMSGNLADGRTAACYRFTGMGHGSAAFRHDERRHDPPILAKHREIPAPVAYDNPIDELLAQEIHFLDTALPGAGEVITP